MNAEQAPRAPSDLLAQLPLVRLWGIAKWLNTKTSSRETASPQQGVSVWNNLGKSGYNLGHFKH